MAQRMAAISPPPPTGNNVVRIMANPPWAPGPLGRDGARPRILSANVTIVALHSKDQAAFEGQRLANAVGAVPFATAQHAIINIPQPD
jgi:hypothetical protein